MTIPCKRPYNRVPLDRAFVARELGIGENDLNRRWQTELVMDDDALLATLRLASEHFDLREMSAILSSRLPWLVVTETRQVWFATTARLSSRRPEEHLASLVGLVTEAYPDVMRVAPGVGITFSLLVESPGFTIDDLPRPLLAQAMALGALVVELPSRGEEIFLSREHMAVFPS